MRHLLACLAILAAFNVTAQVDGFQVPYNPDSEPDGYIGVADVLEVLSNFGSQFSPDDIYTNGDSTHVVMNVGSMTYPECEYTCQFTLPGSWRVATMADAGGAWPSIRNDGAWINQYDAANGLDYSWVRRWFWDAYGSDAGWAAGTNDFDDVRSCYCATQERPKVEYLVFDPMESWSTDGAVEFDSWLNEKAQEGWKLMPTPSGYAEPGTWVFLWRWAD